MPNSLLALLQQGGFSLYPLGICSVIVIAVILERMWAFGKLGVVPEELIRRVEQFLANGKKDQAVRLLDESRSPYARIAKAGLLRRTSNPQELEDMLTLATDAELHLASKPLPVVGTIGYIAVFIGLFGTVLGIMKEFHRYATEGAAAAGISAGIAEALIATAAGLLVAIVAVIANNWMEAWVDDYRLKLERFSTQWAYLLQETQAAKTSSEEPVV